MRKGLKLSFLASRSYEMFADPVHFQVIRISVPTKAIYARLGFRTGMTMITPQEQERMEFYVQEASDIIELKGAIRTFPIKQMNEIAVVLDEYTLESRSLARMLFGCSHILLMGATAGPRIMDAISEATASDDLTRAVVLDAAASEMTDSALNWIMSYTDQELRRNSWKLTKKRFSAGYGDFSIENQLTIFDLLRLDVIGVSITDTCVLIPEKSVTAIAGIGTSSNEEAY
jgi:hypothetical protein